MTRVDQIEAEGNRQAYLREQAREQQRIAMARIAKREVSWRKKLQRPGPVIRIVPSLNK